MNSNVSKHGRQPSQAIPLSSATCWGLPSSSKPLPLLRLSLLEFLSKARSSRESFRRLFRRFLRLCQLAILTKLILRGYAYHPSPQIPIKIAGIPMPKVVPIAIFSESGIPPEFLQLTQMLLDPPFPPLPDAPPAPPCPSKLKVIPVSVGGLVVSAADSTGVVDDG